MARQTAAQKALKAIEKRVEQAYYRTCSGVQINMMDIPKVFRFGVAVIQEDPAVNDETLGLRVRAFVDTIRCN